MNKLTIPAILGTMTLIVPALFVSGFIPIHIDNHVLSPVFEEDELMQRSEAVLHGTIKASESSVEFDDGGATTIPIVYTTWTIQPIEVLKGANEKSYQFKTSGGRYNNIEQTQHIEFENGDEVIVFLSKSSGSIWGESYYLTGIESGVFKIKDDVAKNELRDVTMSKDDLKNLLRSMKR